MQKSHIISFLLIGLCVFLCPYSSPGAQDLEVVGSYYFNDSETAHSIYVEGNYAYLARNGEGLVIIDISDLSAPFVTAVYDTSGVTFHGVVIQNNKAYLAVCGIGILILDVSNPNIPTLLGSSDIHHQSHAIFVKGDLAYLAHCEYNLSIFNVADPHDPILLYTHFYDYHFAWDISVRYPYAFLLIRNLGLKIFDISNPDEPFITSFWNDQICANRFDIWGNVAFITTLDHKINIVDISDVYNPAFIVEYDLDTLWSSDLVAKNNRAYITGTELVILDISNPTNPSLLAESDYNVGFNALFVQNDLIFMAGFHWFYIVRYSPSTSVESPVELPEQANVLFNTPNPFNSSTTINFDLHESGLINLSIYNIQGRRVAELLRGIRQAGGHSITWDASDYTSGVYFARLEAGGSLKTAKMVLLK